VEADIKAETIAEETDGVVEADIKAETIAEETDVVEENAETIAEETDVVVEADIKAETIVEENAEIIAVENGETIIVHQEHRIEEKDDLFVGIQTNRVVGDQKKAKADLDVAETQHGVFI